MPLLDVSDTGESNCCGWEVGGLVGLLGSRCGVEEFDIDLFEVGEWEEVVLPVFPSEDILFGRK